MESTLTGPRQTQHCYHHCINSRRFSKDMLGCPEHISIHTVHSQDTEKHCPTNLPFHRQTGGDMDLCYPWYEPSVHWPTVSTGLRIFTSHIYLCSYIMWMIRGKQVGLINPDSYRMPWPTLPEGCHRQPQLLMCCRASNHPYEQQRSAVQKCMLSQGWGWHQLGRTVCSCWRRQPRIAILVLLPSSVTNRLGKFLRTTLKPL